MYKRQLLGYAYLTAGTHLITLTNIQRYDIYPNSIKFTPVEIDGTKIELKTGELKAPPTDEDSSCTIQGSYEGLSYANIAFDSIQAVSADESIATVSIGNDEGSSLKTLVVPVSYTHLARETENKPDEFQALCNKLKNIPNVTIIP